MVNHLTCDELCFPEELWMRIASLSCDSFTQWARTWRCVCRRTNSLVWYRDNVREDFIVVPSILAPTVQRGVLLSARSNQKVLLLKPGIYREGVRITHNVLVVGLGHAGAAVVETAGWEAALTFAGLGAASCTYMGVDGTSTGEKATICNLTLQCRNQQQAYCAVVVRGRPTFKRCTFLGSVQVSGAHTRPTLSHCRIHGSRSCGLKITDHAAALVLDNHISANQRQGVLVERHAAPVIKRNWFEDNGLQNILADLSSSPLVQHNRTRLLETKATTHLQDEYVSIEMHVAQNTELEQTCRLLLLVSHSCATRSEYVQVELAKNRSHDDQDEA
mmetsp:Transcript_49153/g.93891  ORF Transcript_49153/g.93891 Transcript_49153/m.93891 type:complete len:332 (+) Transcript_49153:123-1118(+)